MVGQYKSKVTCPDCRLESITFDPFLNVTLPIPDETFEKELQFYVLFKNNEKKTRMMSIYYSKFKP